MPKGKDSAEPACGMKHSCKTLPFYRLSRALSQCHPANTQVTGELLTPALAHEHKGAQGTAAREQEGWPECFGSMCPLSTPKGGNLLFHYCLWVTMSTGYSKFFTSVLHCKHQHQRDSWLLQSIHQSCLILMQDPFESRNSSWLELDPAHQNPSRYSTQQMMLPWPMPSPPFSALISDRASLILL